MLTNWRAWVLLILSVGPIAAYVVCGSFWLYERGWVGWAFMAWVVAGVLATILAERWTRSRRQLMPPIDWDAPRTFAPFDRQAWDLVQEEAERSDAIPIEALTDFDTYIETGRRLSRRLAVHYHPLSTDPIEHVPIVEMLTALELAAEDLNRLCRQVPGGDLITPAHGKRAVQAAGYINWANEVYGYLLPIFQPLTGLARLGAQKLMVKPAWKAMQQNLLRWLFRAFVNRLGTHLIEMYSGRLMIGADRYRKLTRKTARAVQAAEEEAGPIAVAVAGARDAGQAELIAALGRALGADLTAVRLRLAAQGHDGALADRLKAIRWVEVEYTASPAGQETARDRATRREAVEQAVEADLLLLVLAAGRDAREADARFVRDWAAWYAEHPGLDVPPALAALVGIDRPGLAGSWHPPHDWIRGQAPREVAVRSALEAARAALPPEVSGILPVALTADAPSGVADLLLPELAALLHRAERVALIRYLHGQSHRSKARRLLSQVGQQGRRAWHEFRNRRSRGKAGDDAA